MAVLSGGLQPCGLLSASQTPRNAGWGLVSAPHNKGELRRPFPQQILNAVLRRKSTKLHTRASPGQTALSLLGCPPRDGAPVSTGTCLADGNSRPGTGKAGGEDGAGPIGSKTQAPSLLEPFAAFRRRLGLALLKSATPRPHRGSTTPRNRPSKSPTALTQLRASLT